MQGIGYQRQRAIDVAKVVSRFIDPDPAYWLEQASLAGMLLWTDGKLVYTFHSDGVSAQTEFLEEWLKVSGGRKALRELLLKRQMASGI